MIKIAILGPESTGKSTLAEALSENFQSPWVPEYAREYIEKLTDQYTYSDVCNIAHRQIEQEDFYSKPENSTTEFVFFDTDLILTKVWFEYKYKLVPEFLTEQLKIDFFDLYLLCAPDLPWEFDPVREHGNDRTFFFDWYKKEIEQTGKPFVTVNGIGSQRINNAINSLENYIQHHDNE